MTMSIEQLRAASMELSLEDREKLAEDLMMSITPADQDEYDKSVLAEIKRRDEAYKRGEMGTVSLEEVMSRLESKVAK